MRKIKCIRFINRYPIASFFVLALALGTGIISLVIQGILPAELALASVLSASIAGVILTAYLDGKAGLKIVFRQVMTWRVGIGYWLFAIFFIVPAFLLGSCFNRFFGGDMISLSQLRPGFNLLPMSLVFFVVVGLGQELGWSGYLMPRLQARYGALTACVLRAVLVAIWHLPLLVYSWRQPNAIADLPYGGWIVQKGFLAAFVVMFVLGLLWSIFYTWMFNNTQGSLLLVAVLHGSEIWTAYWMMRTGIDPKNLDNYWGYGAVLILVATVMVITAGPKDLSRKYSRIVHSPILPS